METLVAEFIKESKSQIEDVREQFNDFITLLREGRHPEFNAFNTLLRAVHSIDGGCSVTGLDDLETVSDRLNKIMSLAVAGKLQSAPYVADFIEKTFRIVEKALDNSGKIKKKDISETEKIFEKVLLAEGEKKFQAKKPENPEKIPQEVKNTENDEVKTQEEKSNEFLSFRIGLEHYAVPIDIVFDMKQMLPCSRIPNQPEYFLGVTNLRGSVVPVIDLRKVFGLKDVSYGEFTVFLMLKVKGKIKGCVVDSIDDVVFLEPENTRSAPAVSRKIRSDFIKFIANDPKTKKFLIVLDIEKMLEND